MDPLILLEVNSVDINAYDSRILHKFGFIDKINIKDINNRIRQIVKKYPEFGLNSATCSWDREYPHMGTHLPAGGSQKVRHANARSAEVVV
ncbi:MAG: hypothetical protein F7C35_01540 [Desulfurococcales archaeon]|nr:hypothetical protein [Desulfurococcales archaeon]